MDASGVKLPDFHTVLDARKVDGSVNKNPIVSQREYLFDAAFTIAIGEKSAAPIPLEKISAALEQPCFTPSLGRRSCPIARPLLHDKTPLQADDAKAALALVLPAGGLIYAEGSLPSAQPLRLRDVPIRGRKRQFATRVVYLHKEPPCS